MTTQEIDVTVSAIAAVTASVSGVNAAPAFAIFNVRENVFALHYVMTSDCEISEIGTMQDLATIACDILTPFVDVLNTDLQGILQIAKAVKLAFIREATSGGDMFGGTIDTFGHCRMEFLPSYLYGNVLFIGYRVMIENAKLKFDL